MILLLFLSVVPFVVAKNELYMGYKVYNVKFTSQEQQDNFQLLKTDIIDYWIKPNFKYGVTGRAMVPPSQFNWFEERLEELHVEKDILIEDVYEYLLQTESKKSTRIDDNGDAEEDGNTNENDNTNTEEGDNNVTDENENNDTDENDDNNTDEGDSNNTNEEDSNITDEDDNSNTEEDDNNTDSEDTEEIDESDEEEILFGYDDYYRYDIILKHIYNLKDVYANDPRVSLDVIEFGSTDNNRPLVYLKITSRNSANLEKPVIVIEGGINPRQWITIPSALNIAEQILAENESNLLENFEWIIIPVVNPDGYEYTHTDLRFWEKNLSTKSNLGFICPGVNINRNFDIAWSTSDSSSSPCSHLFAGDEASSEIETRFLQSIIETYKERISLYISLQNGGRFVSYPWQYEFAASGMFRQHHLLGMEIVEAFSVSYGLDVASVAIGDRISGTSSDFARINNALYVFNYDIIGSGTDGVLVPEIDIVYFVEDVWRAVSIAADYLIREINR